MSVNSNGYIHLRGNMRNIYILLLLTAGWGQDPPEEFQFNQSTQQAFYFFGTATIGGESLDGDDWIGSFRNGYCSNPVAINEEICDILGEEWNPEEICVGARRWGDCEEGTECDVPAMGDDGAEYTIGYMTTGVIPTFKIYDVSEDEYLDAIASEDYPWAPNEMFIIESLESACDPPLEIDECGVCGGDGSEDLGCGCFEPGPSGCDNVCGSTLEDDECGVCGGDGSGDLGCGCFAAGPSGCDNVCGSTLENDECNVCGGDNSTCTGCMDDTACNYNDCNGDEVLDDPCTIEDNQLCSYPEEVYLNCDGTCITDTDSDTVCDELEVVGCQDETACNYDVTATDSCSDDDGDNIPDCCTYTDDICETCSGETDGSGIVVDNDADDDTVCDDMDVCEGYDDTVDADGDGTPDGCYLSIYEGISPDNYSISSIYPNPFNPVTKITYGLPENTDITISVYNMKGTQITTLVNTFQTAGYHSVNWNADNLPSGVYLIRMDSGDFTQTQKVVLVK